MITLLAYFFLSLPVTLPELHLLATLCPGQAYQEGCRPAILGREECARMIKICAAGTGGRQVACSADCGKEPGKEIPF